MLMEMNDGSISSPESPFSHEWDLGAVELSVFEHMGLSSSSSRDPKDVYNLIPGEELSRSKENRRPSSGITPPPPSPMHVANTNGSNNSNRVPLKEKSSSVEGKVNSAKSGRTSDGSRSASPELEASLLHASLCHARSTPVTAASAIPIPSSLPAGSVSFFFFFSCLVIIEGLNPCLTIEDTAVTVSRWF
jgi:hypothetical protein